MDQPKTMLEQVTVTAPPMQPVGRLTATETVYHQTPGAQPTAIDTGFSRATETDEQPYSRKVKVGEIWQPLDTGWLGADVGMLVIQNDEGKNWQVNPTPAERRAAAERVVEVGFGTALVVVRAGESCRFEPASAETLTLRCRKGTARCTITAYPR